MQAINFDLSDAQAIRTRGQSGNPEGRRKRDRGWTFLDAIRSMEPEALLVVQRVMNQVQGKTRQPTAAAFRAAETVIAYSRGRPAQTQMVRVIRSLDDLTNEELELLIGDKPSEAGEEIDGTSEEPDETL
jgi:hypothetical protein